jgi:hypothetical protein
MVRLAIAENHFDSTPAGRPDRAARLDVSRFFWQGQNCGVGFPHDLIFAGPHFWDGFRSALFPEFHDLGVGVQLLPKRFHGATRYIFVFSRGKKETQA